MVGMAAGNAHGGNGELGLTPSPPAGASDEEMLAVMARRHAVSLPAQPDTRSQAPPRAPRRAPEASPTFSAKRAASAVAGDRPQPRVIPAEPASAKTLEKSVAIPARTPARAAEPQAVAPVAPPASAGHGSRTPPPDLQADDARDLAQPAELEHSFSGGFAWGRLLTQVAVVAALTGLAVGLYLLFH
jgi:hypothetical protein